MNLIEHMLCALPKINDSQEAQAVGRWGRDGVREGELLFRVRLSLRSVPFPIPPDRAREN